MTTSPEASKISPLAVFRNRDFSFLWTAQLISTIGSSLTSLAASIMVYRLTGSALSVGLMLMATAAPSIVVGLIAGVYVDRYNRKRIMIISDLLRAVLVVMIPFLVPYSIAWLYIMVAISSAIGRFFDPALESVLPEVASDEDLAAANSMMAISSFGSTAIGFAASGLIASQYPIEWAFYLDGLTFLLSSLCLLFVHVPKLVIEGKTTAKIVVRNLKAGTRFLYDSPILRSLLIISVPAVLSIGLWNSLLLPFAIDALNATEFEYGIQEGLASIGFVLGSLFMARDADRFREGQWITLSYIGMGVVGALFAMSTRVPVAIALVAISGFMNAPSSIARRLVIQRNTTRQIRGRVTSAFLVSRDVLFLVGMAAAGLADIFNIRGVFLVSAMLLLGAGILALFLPGLGQPAAEWKRAVGLLRAAPSAPGLGEGRLAIRADMDLLVGFIPAFSGLSAKEQKAFIANGCIYDAEEGTTILRQGEVSDTAYFVLSGQAVAGYSTEEGKYRSLSKMNAGDFFGEIAALTGSPRTANVVAAEPTSLLQVSAENLRGLMGDPRLSQLFLTTMSERLHRTHISDMPRFASLDEAS
ncbi:MAG: MFS transporter, partial [Anaerolineales bacterium]|nr:MFS transporter [Anaerolineales bacterium]